MTPRVGDSGEMKIPSFDSSHTAPGHKLTIIEAAAKDDADTRDNASAQETEEQYGETLER